MFKKTIHQCPKTGGKYMEVVRIFLTPLNHIMSKNLVEMHDGFMLLPSRRKYFSNQQCGIIC